MSKDTVSCVLLLLCSMLLSFPGYIRAAAKSLPELRAPAVYKGEYTHKKGIYRAMLFLDNASFVLDEETTLSSGKKNSQQIRGRWHQIRDDSLLQLTNRSGFYRRLNVGGAGNLYLGIPLASGKQGTAVLSLQHNARPPTYTLEGTLRLTIGGAAVLDPLSATEHMLCGGDVLAHFVNSLDRKNDPSPFVQVAVRPDVKGKDALHVLHIQRIPKPESRFLQSTSNGFQDGVAGFFWCLTRLEQRKKQDVCLLLFTPDGGKPSGKVEIRDGEQILTGSYTLRDTRLTLTLQNGVSPLVQILRRVQFWQMDGDILELQDDSRQIALLEKISPGPSKRK